MDNPPPTAELRGLSSLKTKDQRWYLDDFADDEKSEGYSPRNSRRASKVNEVADRVWADGRARREDFARYWSMYLNYPVTGLTPRRFTHRTMTLANKKLTFNGCRAAVDSYVAKVTNQNPRVMFSTSGANWEVRQRGKRLERFNDGMLYEQDMYEQGRQLETDAGVVGTAVEMLVPEGEDSAAHITYQRGHADEFACDDEEAYRGDPRCMYRRLHLDRLQAMAMFPDVADEIAQIQRANDVDDNRPSSNATDSVCVTWAWHLPSGMEPWGRGGTDTGDGLLVITVGSVKALEENCVRYPFEFLYVQKPSHGIWGDGFVSQLMPLQFELDDLLNMTRQAMRTASVRYLYDKTAQVNTMSIAGIPGSFIGVTPQGGGGVQSALVPITPPAVAPEVYAHMDRIWGKMFEVVGISQLSAQSIKPAGLNSGKAIQTYIDVESERFQVSFRLYQNFFLRLARQTIAMARELADENAQFMVKCLTRKTMKAIKWADADLDDDDFAMKEYATSAFALSPEARMQQVQDALNSGSPLITPKEGRRLLNDPDLDAFDAVADASYNLVMDQIEDILEHGKFSPPVDKMNLDEALQLGQFHSLEAIRQEAPQEHIDMLDDWIQQVMDMMPPPPQPAAPPGAPPGANPPPPGPPMAPPAPPIGQAA